MALRYGVWSTHGLHPTPSLREAMVDVWGQRAAGRTADIVHHTGDGRWHTITGEQVTVTEPDVQVPAPTLRRRHRNPTAVDGQDLLFELVAS